MSNDRADNFIGSVRGRLYRVVMRLAHRFNWHYAPPIYPDGDTMLWCKWCGFREVVQKRDYVPAISVGEKESKLGSAVKLARGGEAPPLPGGFR